MNWTAAIVLALVTVAGCEPRVVEALALTGQGRDAGPDAGTGGATQHGDPARSALAYYGFDEGSGSLVHDGSGHGHDGALLGGAWVSAGRFGGAIRFAAPDAGVVIDPFPQPVKSWSVSFWLHVESADLSEVSTVLSNEITFTGGWEVNVQPKNATFGNVEFAFWVGDRYAKASCDCVPLGAWTHVVAVVDGAAFTIQLFHDDVPTAPAASMHEFSPGNPYLYLGRWGGTGRPLVGMLDEVAIFDRALSTAEVSQLYAGVMP